jgi:hypothetical protein
MSAPSLTLAFKPSRNILDSFAGPLKYDSPAQPRPRTQRTLRYLLETRDDMLAARTFVRETAAGRLRSFWVPMWTEDLHLADSVLAASADLVITRIGYDALYRGAGLGREDVALFPRIPDSGPLLVCRRISSTDASDTTETLTLDATVGHDLTADDLACFLLLCRADDDKLDLVWETMINGTLEIPLIDLPMEATGS